MNNAVRHRIAGLLIAALIFLADQAVKALVTGTLAINKLGDSLTLLPFFNFTYTQNFGVSLGLFTAGSPEGRWALVGMTVSIALFVFVWMMRERKMGDIVALAMVLGGAAGNIRDRTLFGFVIDYADLHFGEWRPFLIFNLADAAITIGVLIILARSLLSSEKPEAKTEPAPES